MWLLLQCFICCTDKCISPKKPFKQCSEEIPHQGRNAQRWEIKRHRRSLQCCYPIVSAAGEWGFLVFRRKSLWLGTESTDFLEMPWHCWYYQEWQGSEAEWARTALWKLNFNLEWTQRTIYVGGDSRGYLVQTLPQNRVSFNLRWGCSGLCSSEFLLFLAYCHLLPPMYTSAGEENTLPLFLAAICFLSAAEGPPSSASWAVAPRCPPVTPAVPTKPVYLHLPSQRLGATSRPYLHKGRPPPRQSPSSAHHLGSCVPSQEPCPINRKQDVKLLCAPFLPLRLPAPLSNSFFTFWGSWLNHETVVVWKLGSCVILPPVMYSLSTVKPSGKLL